jgi:hypothetical protein
MMCRKMLRKNAVDDGQGKWAAATHQQQPTRRINEMINPPSLRPDDSKQEFRRHCQTGPIPTPVESLAKAKQQAHTDVTTGIRQ